MMSGGRGSPWCPSWRARRPGFPARRRQSIRAAPLRATPFVTKTSCAAAESLWDRDAPAPIVMAMDVVAIVLGIAMFAILILMIEGIDRV